MEFDDNDIAALKAVEKIAAARGVSNAQVAIAWLMQKPGVSAPIVGASKPKHLEDAIAAVELKLSDEEIDGAGSALQAKARRRQFPPPPPPPPPPPALGALISAHWLSSPARRSLWRGKMSASGLARVADRWG